MGQNFQRIIIYNDIKQQFVLKYLFNGIMGNWILFLYLISLKFAFNFF